LHGLLAATVDAQPLTLHANIGITRNPRRPGQRTQVARLSSALMWAANERLIVTVDAGTESNADPARGTWTKTGLAGVIYTVQPSLDIDIGYLSSVRASAPVREWLAGLTYRFAP
jgi:hypothetical protein